MTNEQLTTEQEDALILSELWIADDNSTINQEEENETSENAEEEVIEESNEEETEEETESEEDNSEEEEETEEKTQKPKNKFAKLLAQRNEARREAEQANEEKEKANSKVQELEAKLKELDDNWDFGNEEYVNTLVEKKIAEREEISDFFEEYDELKSYKKEILSYKEANWLDIEKATKLYLADNNPSLLLSPQARAKQKAKVLETPWRTSKKIQSWELTYSDSEFEKLAAEGKIQF